MKAEEKGIGLELNCDQPLPQTVLTDAVRLRQVLINLVGNAIKFTEHGGVRIVARLEAGGKKLAFDVIDSGIGISAEGQKSIFEPFAQADTSITRRFGGTGLGLAISRQLARAMGGDITLTSSPGAGSTFTVTVDPGPLEGVPLVTGCQVSAVGSGRCGRQHRSEIAAGPRARGRRRRIQPIARATGAHARRA